VEYCNDDSSPALCRWYELLVSFPRGVHYRFRHASFVRIRPLSGRARVSLAIKAAPTARFAAAAILSEIQGSPGPAARFASPK
jgi:hypothetical protein